jgi:hypothetical protein
MVKFMMRWKLWDRTQGEPPEYAVIIKDDMVVLQESREVHMIDKDNGVTRYLDWQDVPLHIESKT